MSAQRGTGAPYGGQGSAPFSGTGAAASSRFFARQVLGAPATVLTISGLNGDSDRIYKIYGYGPITAFGGSCSVELNGTGASGSVAMEIAPAGVTTSFPAANRIVALTGEATAARVTGTHFELTVNAVRGAGLRQTVRAVSYGVWIGSTLHEQFHASQDTNLAANLTTITITSPTANAFGTGFILDILGDTNAF